jgi:arginyl-tRNA synthetase
MSTRSGDFVTLKQLVKEVGKDATRFFYLARKSDQHMDFDIELAKSNNSNNPVYYIQYAYARICSIFRQLEENNMSFNYNKKLS